VKKDWEAWIFGLLPTKKRGSRKGKRGGGNDLREGIAVVKNRGVRKSRQEVEIKRAPPPPVDDASGGGVAQGSQTTDRAEGGEN